MLNGTRLALAGQADPVAVVDTGRHLHRQCAGLALPALAVTVRAGIADLLAAALASGTGLLDGKYPLLHAHLAHTAAGRTGLFLPVLGAAAVAGLAFAQRRHTDFPVDPVDGLFQVQVHRVAQVRTALPLRPAPAAATKNIAENIAENIADITVETTGSAGPARPLVDARMPELVVGGTFLGSFRTS